jgi:hypothetical protein
VRWQTLSPHRPSSAEGIRKLHHALGREETSDRHLTVRQDPQIDAVRNARRIVVGIPVREVNESLVG